VSKRKEIEGWIFDAYPEADGIRLWAIEGDGFCRNFLDPWRASLLIGELRPGEVPSLLRDAAYPVSTSPGRRRDLFTGAEKEILEVRVPPQHHRSLVRRLTQTGHTLYNADIHPVQAYHYDRGHFPLAYCRFELDGDTLMHWELKDQRWAIDYALPPLRTMRLQLAGSETAGAIDPNHAPRGSIILAYDGEVCELEGPLDQQLEALKRRLEDWDPDIITTEWGDDFLLPKLVEWSRLSGIDLPLSRDPRKTLSGRGQRSFHSYGRAIYQHGISYLYGRWHLDMRNSFTLKESGLHGLFELARISSIPVQRAARTTIGTSLSSMQMRQALADDVLIPVNKAQAEDFRSAEQLLIADKGGLVYEPEIGWHEEVAEYDFVSMYPTLMVDWNISPETVNCPCCPHNKVPEIGHHLCKKRKGLVPKVLAPILKKRLELKRLKNTDHPRKDIYAAQASAHKWVLVCCFGYLGFKNARFGKIEAHECVTACGREVLLRAKEAVERRGFKMLHALVDAVWIQGRLGMDYEALRDAIEKEAGCPVGIEGIYRWIRFCASKVDKQVGVPARYFGTFKTGEQKIRGLALRRRDTPQLLKDMQNEILATLARADTLKGLKDLHPQIHAIADSYRERLRDGRVDAEELAITFNISKDPMKYKHDTLNALAAKQLVKGGLQLHPGEKVRYVIVSAKDPVKDWRTRPLALSECALEYDMQKYLQLLERAVDEIMG
jgi:DNA polymerase elongation subunit (family B)